MKMLLVVTMIILIGIAGLYLCARMLSESTTFYGFDGTRYGTFITHNTNVDNGQIDKLLNGFWRWHDKYQLYETVVSNDAQIKLSFGLKLFKSYRSNDQTWVAIKEQEEPMHGALFYYFRNQDYIGSWVWLGDPKAEFDDLGIVK
jgi:hypothetical protein